MSGYTHSAAGAGYEFCIELRSGFGFSMRSGCVRCVCHPFGPACFLPVVSAPLLVQNDWTPLACAAFKGSVPVAQLLLEKGADKEGKTNVSWSEGRGVRRCGERAACVMQLCIHPEPKP